MTTDSKLREALERIVMHDNLDATESDVGRSERSSGAASAFRIVAEIAREALAAFPAIQSDTVSVPSDVHASVVSALRAVEDAYGWDDTGLSSEPVEAIRAMTASEINEVHSALEALGDWVAVPWEPTEAMLQAACDATFGPLAFSPEQAHRAGWSAMLAAAPSAPVVGEGEANPIDMLLYCPTCGLQHIDEPDDRTPGWVNPPHRSHLCHGCGTIWRPADVPTNGVVRIATIGKADTWGESNSAALATPPQSPPEPVDVGRAAIIEKLYAYRDEHRVWPLTAEMIADALNPTGAK